MILAHRAIRASLIFAADVRRRLAFSRSDRQLRSGSNMIAMFLPDSFSSGVPLVRPSFCALVGAHIWGGGAGDLWPRGFFRPIARPDRIELTKLTGNQRGRCDRGCAKARLLPGYG
jgi:hypothetical protein